MSSILGSKRDNTEGFNQDSNKKEKPDILEKYKLRHAEFTANVDEDPFSKIFGLKDIDKKYDIMTKKGGKRKGRIIRKTRKGRIIRKTRKGRKSRRR
jgi:hypothetical protein